MNTKHSPGLLIAIDGIDGAGKTTQVNAIAEVLRRSGLDVTTSKEPTDGVHGLQLRESAKAGRLTLDRELELFLADRKDHIEQKIGPALESGHVVILDRYYYSTLAYQGARGADVNAISGDVFSAIQPDKAFIFDLPESVAVSRIREGRNETPNEFEDEAYLGVVRMAFLEIQSPEISVIDATKSPVDLTKLILDELIETSFRDHFCAKSGGCDEFYCFARISEQCRWADLQKGIYDRADAVHSEPA